MKNIIKIVILMTCVISTYSASDLIQQTHAIFKEDSIFTNILSRAKNLEDLNSYIKELYTTGNIAVRKNILKNGIKIISKFLKNRFGEEFSEEIFLKLKDPNVNWENSSEKIGITNEQEKSEKDIRKYYLDVWEALKFYIKWSKLDALGKILIYYNIDNICLEELNKLHEEKYDIKHIIEMVTYSKYSQVCMKYAERLHFLLNIGFANFKGKLFFTPLILSSEPDDAFSAIEEVYTVLIVAVRGGNKKIVELLLRAGAGVDVQVDCRSTHEGWGIYGSDGGYTPLMVAVMENDKEIVEALLNFGANPNLKSKFGYTAFQLLGDYSHKEIAQLLIANGAIVSK